MLTKKIIKSWQCNIKEKRHLTSFFDMYLHVRNDSEIRENYHCGCNDFLFYKENHLLRPLKRCALLNRLNISPHLLLGFHGLN